MKTVAFGLAKISSLGNPLLECLEQRVAKSGLDRRRSCERGDAQGLNAAEFIEMEIEDQGDNNLQVEFAPLVFNPSSERILEAIRDVEPLSFDFSVCG